MSIHKINLKFFSKYNCLLGLNIFMHETFSMETEEAYDGIDIELGIGIAILTISLLKKRKGAE